MGAGSPKTIIPAIQEAIKAESAETNLLDQTDSNKESMHLSSEQTVKSSEKVESDAIASTT